MTEASPSSIETEIKSFFAEYVEGFARGDAEAIANLWDEVGLFPAPTGNFSMERDAFKAHCMTLLDFYRQQNDIEPFGELINAEELFPNVAMARMRYQMRDADGATVAGWEHVYILRKTDRWRVSLTIADDEMAAWAAKGAAL